MAAPPCSAISKAGIVCKGCSRQQHPDVLLPERGHDYKDVTYYSCDSLLIFSMAHILKRVNTAKHRSSFLNIVKKFNSFLRNAPLYCKYREGVQLGGKSYYAYY